MQTTHFLELKELARRAHYHTSFSPEVRGEQIRHTYGEQLAADLAELQAAGIDTEQQGQYRQKFTRLFSTWLSAKGRVISPMITGPARFPVARNQKALRSEDNHYTVFQEWRTRAKRAIIRKAQPVKTFLSELDRYRAELASMKANHEKMKEGNKRIAQARKTGEDLTQYLTDTFNIKPHMIEWTLKYGFGLANNSANIRRVEDRIKQLEAKEQRSNTTGEEEFTFDGFKIIYNHEADRLQVQHDSKPAPAVIASMKSNGFRWSPSNMAWQRQLTSAAISAARRLFSVDIPHIQNA